MRNPVCGKLPGKLGCQLVRWRGQAVTDHKQVNIHALGAGQCYSIDQGGVVFHRMQSGDNADDQCFRINPELAAKALACLGIWLILCTIETIGQDERALA